MRSRVKLSAQRKLRNFAAASAGSEISLSSGEVSPAALLPISLTSQKARIKHHLLVVKLLAAALSEISLAFGETLPTLCVQRNFVRLRRPQRIKAAIRYGNLPEFC